MADWQNMLLRLKVTVSWDMAPCGLLGSSASEEGAASIVRDAGSNWMQCPVTELEREEEELEEQEEEECEEGGELVEQEEEKYKEEDEEEELEEQKEDE